MDKESRSQLLDTITQMNTQEQTGYEMSNRIRNNIRIYYVTDEDIPFQWLKIRKDTQKKKKIGKKTFWKTIENFLGSGF